MMYWMAMSGSNEPVCGSAVSLDEPPTMPTMRSPPLVGLAPADAELLAVVSSLLPHAAAIGPSAAAAPIAAAPLIRLRREKRLSLTSASSSPNPEEPRCSLSVTIPVPLSWSFPEGSRFTLIPSAMGVHPGAADRSMVTPPATSSPLALRLHRPSSRVALTTTHPGG